MKKVFVISLHRSGTQSLDKLLKEQGYNTLHWPTVWGGVDYQALTCERETDHEFIVSALHPVLAAHDAVSDVPICAVYEKLAEAFPDAAFVSLIRPAEDWLKSIRRHASGRPLDPYERTQYWRYLSDRPLQLESVDDKALIDMHGKHYHDIEVFFSGSNRYFGGHLLDKDVGEKLSLFLSLPPQRLPDVDFRRG